MQKLLLIVISFIATSSNVIVAQDKVLTLNEKIAINNLKDHVMSERKETVANQIKYPLDRCDYFEYNINDKNDFINSFDKIFDSKQIEEFQVSKWEYVYYPMFEYYSLQGEGYIGEFDDSGKMKLTHIPLSESETIYIQGLIDREKKSLHPSLRNYVEPICLLFAGKYRIRIDLMHDGNIRYSSWKKDAATSAIPDLVIYNGKSSGNRWGINYDFKNGEYEYHIEDYFIGEGPCFNVSKNGKTIMEISPDNIQIKRFSRSWSIL